MRRRSSRRARAEMPVLIPSTATRRFFFASRAAAADEEEDVELPSSKVSEIGGPSPPSAFLHGCRVCSSSHSAEICAFRTRMMASLRASAAAAAGCAAVSTKGSGLCESSCLPRRRGSPRKARSSCLPWGRGGSSKLNPTPGTAGEEETEPLSLPPPFFAAAEEAASASLPQRRWTISCGVSSPAETSPTRTPST